MIKLFLIVVLGLLLSANVFANEIEVSSNGKYQNEEVSVFLSVNEKKNEITIKNEVGFLTEEFMDYNYKTTESGFHDISQVIWIAVDIYLKDKLVRMAEYAIDDKFKSLQVKFIDHILAEDVGNNRYGFYSYDLRCKFK